MNDRFRFRVWDIVNRKYAEFIYENFYEYLTMPNRCVVEQCTGLKDKNGDLIYEGDIVRYTFYANRALYGNYGDSKYRGVIRWETNGFNTKSYADKIEVIGNIHENPELLEDKQDDKKIYKKACNYRSN